MMTMDHTSPGGLPEFCYAESAYTHAPVKILRGENAFFGISARGTAAALNAALGITPRQAAAMEGGVRYGWSSRHADVRCYDVTGRYTGPDEIRKEGF